MKKYILPLFFALMASLAVQAQSYQDFQRYLSEAKSGNRDAQFNVGLFYHTGKAGVKKDYQQAVYWYRKAADQGQINAQGNLGYLYVNGIGVTQDYSQAAYWYRKAADQGDMSAQASLGYLYFDGKGLTQDYSQAVYWFRKAADQGEPDAMFNLAFCYYRGNGVSQDYKQAAYWYEKAAEEGHMDAQARIAGMYSDGEGVSEDHVKAVKWYTLAAEQGHFLSQNRLIIYYTEGTHISRDYTKAAYWCAKLSEYVVDADENIIKAVTYDIFIANAQCQLGYFYENGLGVPQNYEQAIALYWQSIETRVQFGEPYFRLGACYEKGRGVASDELKAMKLYKMAADNGYRAAATALGDMSYRYGLYESAAEWYYDAVSYDGKGTYMYGYLCENGLHMSKDIDAAAYYYKVAADLGYELAIEGLKRVYDVDKENSYVFEWVNENQSTSDPYAQYILGCYYLEGEKLTQDYDKAMTFLGNASIAGIKEADRILNDPANAKIWKKVKASRKRAEIKDEFEYRMWKFGKYMSTFNSPKSYTSPLGVSMGYVSKRWDYIWSDGTKEHASIFDDTKLINGLQAGIRWEPELNFGFGFDTGLYYEYYQDKSDMMDDGDGYGPYYVRMSEHCLHFPAHLEYRLNFSQNFQVFFYGGVALDTVLYGKFDYFDEGSSEPFGIMDEDLYAGEVLPDIKRFNASWSFGGGVRVMSFQLNVGTRMGFRDMASSADYHVYQNCPFLVSLSLML